MAEPRKKQNQVLIIKLIFFIIILFTTINYQIRTVFNNQENNFDYIGNNDILYISQGPSNDTTAPIITFIKPEINNTIITIKSYTLIVNITDENPPLFGNVTFQLSNFSNFLFNAPMSFMGGNQWNFIWDNISLYPYYTGYIFQIIAVDSSSNHNLGISGKYYIFLNVQGNSPGILNIYFYVILVGLVFAVIIVYLNRRILRKATGKAK